MNTALTNPLRTRLRRVIGKAAFALVLVGAVSAAPAMAQEWHGDRGYHDGWRAHEAHERWENEHMRWEHRYYDPYYRHYYYSAPPPVYYAPPAPYYAPGAYVTTPGLSVQIR